MSTCNANKASCRPILSWFQISIIGSWRSSSSECEYWNYISEMEASEYSQKKQEYSQFCVDDLLVLDLNPNDNDDDPLIHPHNHNNSLSSTHSSDLHFSTHDLCFSHLPYEEMAELEWVSNVVDEESFCSEELRKMQLISGINPHQNDAAFQPDPEFHANKVPAKARSKRSRASPSPTTSSAAERRKCVHCATDKTPQWRTGPMGPKTLCNACGVRYKSGRLVPEYRPASSPTFVLTKHSNSHRKVMELRRQKQMLLKEHHPHHPNMLFGVDTPSNAQDYLIHQHVGPDFTHFI